MPLFRRQVYLQIGTEGDEGKSFRDLRVAFRTKATRSSTLNEGVIQVWNVNPDTVALAQNPDAVIRLWAGYDVPQMIFQGNPVEDGVVMKRQGPDRILSIEAQDGLRAYQEARVSVSFTTETTLEQLYATVAEQLGLPEGTIRVDSSFRFTQGGTFSGYARDVLERIAQSTGSGWFIRDGALQLVGVDEDTGERAVVFSSTTGNLIGSPERTDKGVEITALLAPTLRPGKPFRLESLDLSGDYIADTVEFQGDSGYSTPFYVKVLGIPKS